jgi:hypothetical protein
MPRVLGMRTLKYGGGEEGSEEGGSPGVLQSWLPSRGLHYKHQRGTCGICVTYVPGGVAPRVVPWSAEPGQGFRVVSHLDTIDAFDALNNIVLTF